MTVTLGVIELVWLLTVSVALIEGITGLPVSVPVDVAGSFDNSQDRLEFEKTWQSIEALPEITHNEEKRMKSSLESSAELCDTSLKKRGIRRYHQELSSPLK